MFGFLLNLLYLCLLMLISPIIIWKQLRHGKYRDGWSHKLRGLLPEMRTGTAPRVWFHAVSVGEVLQLQQVLDEFRSATPNAEILITTTTETGHQVAMERFPFATVAYYPLDFTWSVRSALDRIQPDLIVLVELELWPNFIRIAHQRGIPLTLINGRLSEKSYHNYQRAAGLIGSLLKRFQLIAVQNEEYANRFRSLGAKQETVEITGSIKFDGVSTNRDHPLTLELRNHFGLNYPENENAVIWMAGSTQEPEEVIVHELYEQLRDDFPNLRLIIVPRHPERANEIEKEISNQGSSVLRRTQPDENTSLSSTTIGMLDTVGELGACWGLADIAFVGGSFGDRGGQNMLEPAAFGIPVCYGPNTKNFRDIVEQLEAHSGSQRVTSNEEFEAFLRKMLTDHSAAQAMGNNARQFVLSQQGATANTVALLNDVLQKNIS